MSGRETEIRSPVVRDILSGQVAGPLRWGTWAVAAGLLAVFMLAWLVRFPEVVSAPIVVTTARPPAPVMAKTSGRVTLFVADGAWVDEGDPLAYIENPAASTELLALDLEVGRAEADVAAGVPTFSLRALSGSQLGGLQASYAGLVRAREALQTFREDDHDRRTLAILRRRLAQFDDLEASLKRNEELALREVEIARRAFDRVRELRAREALSETDVQREEEEFTARLGNLEAVRERLIEAALSRSQTQRELIDVGHDLELRERALVLDLRAAFQLLRSALSDWKDRFVLSAPMSGTVSLFEYWSSDQFVRENDRVLTIVPDSRQQLIGQSMLPLRGAGRVEVGQAVHIRFDSYPHREFGTVDGVVRSISLIPRDSRYRVEVELTNGLRTRYGIELDFMQEMPGTAEIITQDLRLADRIFYQIRGLVSPVGP